MIELGDQSASPKCNGRSAVQCSAEQSRVRLLPVEHVGRDGSRSCPDLRLPLPSSASRRPELAGAEHGMRHQRAAILRTTDKPPHITVDQLDPVGELRPGSGAASDSD